MGINSFAMLELSIEKRCRELTRQERRTNIHPRILAHFTPGERFAIGTLLPDDFRAFD
ncbi:hypothetical protein D3C81_1198400 [compost metagenome]